MTFRSKLFSCFPAFYMLTALVLSARTIAAPNWVSIAILFAHLYALPVACYRLHQAIWPIREGSFRLDLPNLYVPWWGGHMFQLPFDAFPPLESALRLVPGLYSIWLRAWGARVGKGVHWTPLVEITDRAFLDVGNHSVIGHRVGFYAHIATRRDSGEIHLSVRRIRIGSCAFVGAYSRFGPGAQVLEGECLPACTDRWKGQNPRSHRP